MKTSELIGPALRWAVCLAEGNTPSLNPKRFGGQDYGIFESELGYAVKHYDTDWAQGGPIIERERICLVEMNNTGRWRAFCDEHQMDGPTPLIAAMRCYCCAKLGDEIEIPEDLK